MKLATAIALTAGGRGSGCNPDEGKCGRPKGSGDKASDTIVVDGVKMPMKDLPFVLDTVSNGLLKSLGYAEQGLGKQDIRGGDCMAWAAVVKRFIPIAELMSTSGHAFVKIGSKYYDAEAPKGVSDWKQLPIFKGKRQSIADTFSNEASFLKEWKARGSSYTKQWITSLQNEIVNSEGVDE